MKVIIEMVVLMRVIMFHQGSSGYPQNHLFLEQAKGYVKALEKSTSAPSTMREVFEHCVERLGRRKNRHVSLPESQPLSRPC
jgi:hypothetical protein